MLYFVQPLTIFPFEVGLGDPDIALVADGDQATVTVDSKAVPITPATVDASSARRNRW